MDTPPDTDLDPARYAALLAVNHDRAQLGLPPLQYDEFVNIGNLLRGAREYWTPEKLAEKAKQQLRNPKTKQFIKSTGIRLDKIAKDLHRGARARVAKSTDAGEAVDELRLTEKIRLAEKRGGTGWGWKKLGPPPASSPTTKVTRLTGDAAIEAMVKAGHDREVMEARYRDRGVIFQVDNPGQNPIHVFVANPKGMVEWRMLVQDDNIRNAEAALEKFQKQHAAAIKAGDPVALEELSLLQVDLEKANALAKRQLAKAEEHYGTGGDEVIGEPEQQLAAEAAALFMEAINDWPEWKLQGDGKPLPFVLEFDESQLVRGEAAGELADSNIADLIEGRAHGTNRINLNRKTFRDNMDRVEEGHVMPNDRETKGQHAVAHEAGHLLDARSSAGQAEGWDSARPAFKRYIDKSHEAVTSAYAKKSQREWYAEMHALSEEEQLKLTPEQRVAVQSYLNMFMLQHAARPRNPSTAWITKHQQWLTQALDAVNHNPPQEPPPLPDPAEFFPEMKPKKKTKKFELPEGFL